MIMDKFKVNLKEVIKELLPTEDEESETLRQGAYNCILYSLIPKLQWTSEEISCYGGDILLTTIHTVTNYHTEICIYEPVNGITHVAWNGHEPQKGIQ